MDFEKLTDRARGFLQAAQTIAVREHHQRITPAHYLKALLDQAGVRYRVVVVSACYSGAFVSPLASPGALVITAANSRRQSFGCGKDSPITEFSKAFYLDALRQTRSFPHAARIATQIVHETERAQKRKHSYPQMRLGVALEDPLRMLEQRLANAGAR